MFNGTAATGGNLDINDFSQAFATDPINIGTITTTTNGIDHNHAREPDQRARIQRPGNPGD